MSDRATLAETIGRVVIVVLVIASATFLAANGSITDGTIATVYGAALGFTTGAAFTHRPVKVRSTDAPANRGTD